MTSRTQGDNAWGFRPTSNSQLSRCWLATSALAAHYPVAMPVSSERTAPLVEQKMDTVFAIV